jgi:hypothetical protein
MRRGSSIFSSRAPSGSPSTASAPPLRPSVRCACGPREVSAATPTCAGGAAPAANSAGSTCNTLRASIATADCFMIAQRTAIILQAARNNTLRCIQLLSPSERRVDFLRTRPSRQLPRSASYLDRILRGGKPEELPVQHPVKFQIALNAKTAATLKLNVPPSIGFLEGRNGEYRSAGGPLERLINASGRPRKGGDRP